MEISKICETCGLHFIWPADRMEHERRHAKVQKARDFFGAEFILFGPEAEQIKAVAWLITNNEANSLPRRVRAAEEIIKAWWARSLNAAGFSLKHPRFLEFTAALLENSFHGLFPEIVYNELVKKFGPASKGIKVTGSYWVHPKGKIKFTETGGQSELQARPINRKCQNCRRGCKQTAAVINCPRFDPISQPTKKGKSK